MPSFRAKEKLREGFALEGLAQYIYRKEGKKQTADAEG